MEFYPGIGRMGRQFFVYILARQRNGTLYTGVTNDLARRVSEHKSGLVPGFTRYGVDRLVHVEDYGSFLEARERERRLERWRREWKLELIEASNPSWRDLANDL